MKKVMCFAVSIFMLVNLSFAASLSFYPIKNFKVEKLKIDMRDEIEVDEDAIVLKPIKIRIGEQEPIPVPTPIKPILEIM